MSSKEPITIYMPLLGEGTDVWRPVKAKQISVELYEVCANDDYDPENERWAFVPGSLVQCVRRGDDLFASAMKGKE